MPKHHVAIELIGNAGRLLRELNRGTGGVRKFGRAVKNEFRALQGVAGSLQGKLAAAGISFGAVQLTKQSAMLDKKLAQIGQTADVNRMKVAALRKEISSMGKLSGQQIDGLVEGFNNLIQSGQSWKASIESARGINIASAVTGAGGGVLAGGLTVGATAFDIDLETPGKALELLDKMVVAGRLGNAELENLAAIFARVGVNAASAGMSYDKTLAFIETLSLVERSPERLATLADSTLRLFTNMRYMAKAQQATGVKFFGDDGKRRDPVAVLKEIRGQYNKLDSELGKASYIQRAFGQADLDTIKGLRTLLGGSYLETTQSYEQRIGGAAGTLTRDLAGATDNLIDQAGRLKETLREAADAFTKPMRDTLSEWIKYGLDRKKLSGGQIIAGGTGLALSGIALARYGPKAIGALSKKFGKNAAGITAGLAVEAATGVQPVFVTNWPAGGLPGSVMGKSGPGRLKKAARALKSFPWLATAGQSSLAMTPVAVAAAGALTSEYMAKSISESQATGYSSDTLRRMMGEQMVMGGGNTYQYRLMEEELAKRELKIGIQIDDRRVTADTDDVNAYIEADLKRGRMH